VRKHTKEKNASHTVRQFLTFAHTHTHTLTYTHLNRQKKKKKRQIPKRQIHVLVEKSGREEEWKCLYFSCVYVCVCDVRDGYCVSFPQHFYAIVTIGNGDVVHFLFYF